VADLDGAVRHLFGAGFSTRRDGSHLYVDEAPDPAEITRVLAAEGIYVRELVTDRPDLETVFLRLTGDRPSTGGAS
jgi:ABC-2 type transport system ATP-binding protein